MATRHLQEFPLIERLRLRFGETGGRILRGIGDDAAVIRPAPSRDMLVTTDLLTEGIHFRLSTCPLRDLGYKSAVANLSDIAAMGGTPEYVLVALAIPSGFIAQQIGRLYEGLMAACRAHGVRLIGGDTSASAGGLFISLTVIGQIRRGRSLFRTGARIDDLIYATGTLGDSLAGLQLLEDARRGRSLSRRHRLYLEDRHRSPSARVEAGRFLARHRLATSAIDISDGLSGDLGHICEQSGVGAEIVAEWLPISSACRTFAESRHTDPIDMALQGGEDYELLFTVSPRRREQMNRLGKASPTPWRQIGIVRPASFGLQLREPDGTLRSLPRTSYCHFQSGPAPRPARSRGLRQKPA